MLQRPGHRRVLAGIAASASAATVRAPLSLGVASATRETRFVVGGIDLFGAVGLGQRWTLEVALPWRLMQRRSQFFDGGGNVIAGVAGPMPDGTVSGLGDLATWGRARLVGLQGGPTTVDVRAGLSWPTGRALSGPKAVASEGGKDAPIFFGTQSFDPLLAAEATYSRGPWRGTAWLHSRWGLQAAGAGGRGAKMLSGGLGLDRGLARGRWRPGVGGSVASEPVGTTASATATVFWLPSPDWQLSIGADVPVWAGGTGAELSVAPSARVGVVRQW